VSRRPVRGLEPQWRGRLISAALGTALGYGVVVLLDLGPRPIGWTLLSVLAFSLAWLVVDTLDADRAQWYPTLPRQGDRVEESTPDQRLLESHAAALEPSGALRDRLVVLARTRDPSLSDPALAALAASEPRRLSPREIDEHLTRIEALRERS
jgi:hypothetical protein